jgi:hypothetical protein
MLMGEVGRATRSMWWNRLGRPRSTTRKYVLATMPASETSRDVRRRARFPVTWPPSASVADAPDNPPVKK